MMRFSLSRMSRRGSRPVLGGGSLREEVFPTRLYQASHNKDSVLVHQLQRLLISSWSAKCLAVRRVTQDNQGKKTAGIDGIKSVSPQQRMSLVQRLRVDLKPRPVRRVWRPKPNAPTEKRGVGIPTWFNRAAQMLLKLALEPEWEAKFEPNSYGFRPGRCSQDAIDAISISINQKPEYVLDADIETCFDRGRPFGCQMTGL